MWYVTNYAYKQFIFKKLKNKTMRCKNSHMYTRRLYL
jgi:hypothetical protein